MLEFCSQYAGQEVCGGFIGAETQINGAAGNKVHESSQLQQICHESKTELKEAKKTQ